MSSALRPPSSLVPPTPSLLPPPPSPLLYGAYHERGTAGSARRALGTPDIWKLVASHGGLADAFRMTGVGVSRAARDGAREWLKTLPGLVGPGRCCPPRHPTHLNPDFLSYTASYDVASIIWQALAGGDVRWRLHGVQGTGTGIC